MSVYIKKVFTIADELCYNISIIGEFGILLPFTKVLKNIGLLIGAIIFSICLILSNFTIFSINITGSAAIYKLDILQKLSTIGVRDNCLLTEKKLKDAQAFLLKDCGYIGFVTLKKNGFRLEVVAQLNGQGGSVIDKKQNLISQVNGVIKSLTVYRGRAQKNVGDSVAVGDIIVSGSYYVGEKEYQTYVLYSCEVITTFTYTCYSENAGFENQAKLLALQELGDYEITNCEIESKSNNNGYLYTVTIYYVKKL